MNTKYFFYIFLLSMALNTGCDRNDCGTKKIDVTVCKQKNPDWLLREIEKITEKTTRSRLVSAHSITQDNTEYVAITDAANSSAVDELNFYLCSGEKIDASTDKYQELKQLFIAKKFIFLWSNCKNKTP